MSPDDLKWEKTSFSSNSGNCVEVAALPGGGKAVRDSKLGDASPVLTYTATEWACFVAGVKAGELH